MTIYSLDGITPDLPDGDDHWVAPDANLIGKVTLEPGASVWFGSTLRGDNERIVVGAGSNIQENCVLHTDLGYPLSIGPNCTIGHKVMLHGCTVGAGCLVGMGAIVLNGAVIGNNCLIGAGALITEGKQIPEGSLVMGAPGKVVRQLDQQAIEGLLNAAEQYRQKLPRYRQGLKEIAR